MERLKMSDQDDNNPDFEQLESSVFRAISGHSDVDVTFRGSNYNVPRLNDGNLSIPQISKNLSEAQMAAIRGMVDSAGLQLKYHNEAIHRSFTPSDSKNSSLIFDAAEKARVESIGSLEMAGIAQNIEDKITFDFLHNERELNNTDKEDPIDDVMYLLIREALTGEKPPSITKDLMDKWGDILR